MDPCWWSINRPPAGALPVAVARAAGHQVAYLPGLTMRRIADLYAGRAKTDARPAFIIADAARSLPHTLRPVDVGDDALAELDVLVGFDDDLAGEATRIGNLTPPSSAWPGGVVTSCSPCSATRPTTSTPNPFPRPLRLDNHIGTPRPGHRHRRHPLRTRPGTGLGPAAPAPDPPRPLAGPQGQLLLVEGTVIRLQVDHLPGDRDPTPAWLCSSVTGASAELVRSALAGVPAPIRPRTHLPTAQADPRVAPPETAYTQLRLTRPITEDLRRPGEKPATEPRRLTPARVRRGFHNLHATIAHPARPTPTPPPATTSAKPPNETARSPPDTSAQVKNQTQTRTQSDQAVIVQDHLHPEGRRGVLKVRSMV